VVVSGGGAVLQNEPADELAMLFNTSGVTVEKGSDELAVNVLVAAGSKCPRCWRYVDQLVTSGARTGLCLRCNDALGAASV
jgi:hypothetical protein